MPIGIMGLVGAGNNTTGSSSKHPDVATMRLVDKQSYRLTTSKSYNKNNFTKQTIFSVDVSLKKGDIIEIFGSVSAQIDGRDPHVLTRIIIDEKAPVYRINTINSGKRSSAYSHAVYTAKKDQNIKIKFQVRGATKVNIKPSTGWQGAFMTYSVYRK